MTTSGISPITIGVVGCGWAGEQGVLAANAVPNTRVVAVADMDRSRVDRVARKHGVPQSYDDHRALLDNTDIEAVYLATAPEGRQTQVLDTLHAGKHVLVQKPHAVRASEIPVLEAAAIETGKTLQFCYFMRHFPHNRQIRRAVQGGKIGSAYHARIFLKYNFLPPVNDATHWLNAYGYKGGVLGQHASHELDLAWWWMGCPKPQWASATRHAVYPHYNGPEGPAEDYFSGLVGFQSGQTIQIDCSRMLHADTPTTLELYGSIGAITGGAISRYADGQFFQEDIDEPVDIPHTKGPEDSIPFYYEIEHFAMAITGEVEPDVSAADAYTFMTILDALYDSALEQERIEIK